MKLIRIRRGDLFYANLNPVIGCEQGDIRPVLVVQNNIGNHYGPTIIIAPITSNLKKKNIPTHVTIPYQAVINSGLEKDSIVLIEQIRTLDRSRFGEYIGCINSKIQTEIDKALAICVGIDTHLNIKRDTLSICLCRRCEANFREGGYLLAKKGWQETKENCDFCGTRQGFIYSALQNKQIPVSKVST